MDWQLKPVSRQSSTSGQKFTPGESVVCFIFKNNQGQLERADVQESETEAFPQTNDILARWTRVIKEPDEELKEAKKQTIQSAEDIFLSLFDEENSTDCQERDILKQFIALMLERKRILKRLNTKEKEVQEYLHSSTQRTFKVPMHPLEPQQILTIQEQLQNLII